MIVAVLTQVRYAAVQVHLVVVFHFHCNILQLWQVKEVLGKKDLLLFFDAAKNTVRQYGTVDVTINCIMTFRMFPYDAQDCFYEMVAIDRTQVEYLEMKTSLAEFVAWPRQFSPTASEFEYEVQFGHLE